MQAAVEIHTKLKSFELDNSIGVTTGDVFCGSVGSDKRQEYAMVGDIVNLSARLMVAAGRQDVGVLCDHMTYKKSTEKVVFEELDPIMVKGKSEPILIYRPLGKQGSRSSHLPSELQSKYCRQASRIHKMMGSFETSKVSVWFLFSIMCACIGVL